MRKSRAVLVLALVSLLVPATLTAADTRRAADVEIKSHFFKFSNIKYFRDKAENVELGSYGEKKDPIGALAYLSVQNRIRGDALAAYAKVRVIPPISIDWAKYKKTDVEANGLVKYFTLGSKVSIGATWEKLKTAKMQLLKLVIDEGPLTNTLNNHTTGALNFLRDEGGDGRVVHEVWVVLDATLATHFTNSTVFEVKGTGSVEVVDVTAKLSAGSTGSGSQTISLSKGTTFAYLMMKVKKWSSGKTKIDDLEDDLKGLN